MDRERKGKRMTRRGITNGRDHHSVVCSGNRTNEVYVLNQEMTEV